MIPTLFGVLAALSVFALTSPAVAQQQPATKDVLTILRVEPVTPVRVADVPAYKLSAIDIPTENAAQSMKDFMEKLGRIFQRGPNALGDLAMDEIEVYLNVSAEGKVQLIVGASLGGVAGIKVTFKRPSKGATR